MALKPNSDPFHKEILETAAELFQSAAPPRADSRPIQTLWGGMGQVLKISRGGEGADDANDDGDNACSSSSTTAAVAVPAHSLIVKFVNPPIASLDSDNVSDSEYRGTLRKLVSFKAEGDFYQFIADKLTAYGAVFDPLYAELERQEGGGAAASPQTVAMMTSSAGGIGGSANSAPFIIDFDCRLPRCYRVLSEPINTAKKAPKKEGYGCHAAKHAFFLEDLNAAGYAQRRHPCGSSSSGGSSSVSTEERDVLSWLAAFHARSMKFLLEDCVQQGGGSSNFFDARRGVFNFDEFPSISSVGGGGSGGRSHGCGQLVTIGPDAAEIWRNGTYWHLGTRPDEMALIRDSCRGTDKEMRKLVNGAAEIDARLCAGGGGGGNSSSSPSIPLLRYPCFVHGDPKNANFCFPNAADYHSKSKASSSSSSMSKKRGGGGDASSSSSTPPSSSAWNRSRIAALDFQYVGLGCGMRDLAYYLQGFGGDDGGGSAAAAEERLLDVYFDVLKKNLSILMPNQKAFPPPLSSSSASGGSSSSSSSSPPAMSFGEAVEAEWRPLYAYAKADMCRFVCGWSGSPWLHDGDRANIRSLTLTASTK